jgi:uncharacterized protein
MPISVACPTCGTKLKAPDDAVGKKVKCPKCASLVVVPAEDDEAASGISSAPAPKPKPKEDEPEEIEDLPEASDEPPLDEGGDDEAGDDEVGDDEGGRKKKKKKKGPGGPVSEDDKLWGMLAHLAGGLFNWLGALIVFLIKKDQSAFLRHHTMESLNFQITMVIGWVVVFILSCCMQCVGGFAALGGELLYYFVKLVALSPFFLLGAVNLVLSLLQGLKAKNGEWSTYPFAIRLIK